MKLSELRPCVSCGKPLVGQGKPPVFYVLRVSLAMVDPEAASGVLGLTQIMSAGRPPSPAALHIAEALAPDAEGFVRIMGDESPDLMTHLVVCQDCFLMKGEIAMWVEKENGREAKRNGS